MLPGSAGRQPTGPHDTDQGSSHVSTILVVDNDRGVRVALRSLLDREPPGLAGGVGIDESVAGDATPCPKIGADRRERIGHDVEAVAFVEFGQRLVHFEGDERRDRATA